MKEHDRTTTYTGEVPIDQTIITSTPGRISVTRHASAPDVVEVIIYRGPPIINALGGYLTEDQVRALIRLLQRSLEWEPGD